MPDGTPVCACVCPTTSLCTSSRPPPPSFSPELQAAEHLLDSWPLTNAPLINRHFSSSEDLEETQAQQCVALQAQPALVRSTTLFHYPLPLPSSIGGHSVSSVSTNGTRRARRGGKQYEAVSSSVLQGGCLWTAAPCASQTDAPSSCYIKLLSFNGWVHPGDSMQVGQRNPLGTVTFTGIDFAAHRQTRVGALL